jgi:hypothetical protein
MARKQRPPQFDARAACALLSVLDHAPKFGDPVPMVEVESSLCRDGPLPQWISEEFDVLKFVGDIRASFVAGSSSRGRDGGTTADDSGATKAFRRRVHDQFVCDFPRSVVVVHGIQIFNLDQFAHTLGNMVDPALHLPLIMVSTQASAAHMFERATEITATATATATVTTAGGGSGGGGGGDVFLVDRQDDTQDLPSPPILWDSSFDDVGRHMVVRIFILSRYVVRVVVQKRLTLVGMDDTLAAPVPVSAVDTYTVFDLYARDFCLETAIPTTTATKSKRDDTTGQRGNLIVCQTQYPI